MALVLSVETSWAQCYKLWIVIKWTERQLDRAKGWNRQEWDENGLNVCVYMHSWLQTIFIFRSESKNVQNV